MFKNKLVVIAMAAMLAMCVGLTACGGSSSASSSAASGSAAASSEAAASTEAASSAAASSEILYWEGTLADGRVVTYLDNKAENAGAICISKSDYSDATVWYGTAAFDENGVVTITDADSKKTITFALVDVTDDACVINIEGYGEVSLKPVTEADFEKYAEDLAAAAASEGEKLLKEIETAGQQIEKQVTDEVNKISAEFEQLSTDFNNLDDKTVFFWDGTLADGSTVTYVDDADNSKAFLCIVAPDYSDGAIWNGTYSADKDGKNVTLTDDESGLAVTYQVVESDDAAMKLKIDEYGDAELKAVTKADLVKLTQDLSKETGENADK